MCVVVMGLGACSSKSAVIVANEFGVPVQETPGRDYTTGFRNADRGTVAFSGQPAGPVQAGFRPGEPIYGYVQMGVPLEYWEGKFCQAVSCDYDHGTMDLQLFIDGAEVAHTDAVFWNDDWEKVHPTLLFKWTGDASEAAGSPTKGYFERTFAMALQTLSSGRHEVAIHLWKAGHPDDILVGGSFSLEVP